MIVLLAILALAAPDPCEVRSTDGRSTSLNDDALARLLNAAKECPRDVFALRATIVRDGGKLETAMVANRGFHNPSQGSFSMFELVLGKVGGITLAPGDAFIGHFTAADGERLVPEQVASANALMIEAFAWDDSKGYYNFYELRGDGTTGRWFYRGDSFDILVDNRALHRQANPTVPAFGNRLRCSACHSGGGPIMKELAEPHNDWWEPKRGLDFGKRTPDPRIAPLFASLVPAERLAEAVRMGIAKLESSARFDVARKATTLQEQLRPLFCPVEVNFESSPEVAGPVQVPTSFFVDPRLQPMVPSQVRVERAAYDDVLKRTGTNFPETPRADADHPWLTPVKGAGDIAAVESLIAGGVIDRETVADILAVDMTEPVFSSVRCGLLRLVPENASGWQSTFAALLSNSHVPGAKELFTNLTDPARTAAFHKEQAAGFIKKCAVKPNVDALFATLVGRREAVASSEISKNPRGQILEPGFRVIFPETPAPIPRTRLNLSCIGELPNSH